MNPQKSEKKKEAGRSQKGFERSRNPGSSPTRGQEQRRHEGPAGQHRQPDDDLDNEERDEE
jgi:hypothetical protein